MAPRQRIYFLRFQIVAHQRGKAGSMLRQCIQKFPYSLWWITQVFCLLVKNLEYLHAVLTCENQEEIIWKLSFDAVRHQRLIGEVS